jgi:hypothetical protein
MSKQLRRVKFPTGAPQAAPRYSLCLVCRDRKTLPYRLECSTCFMDGVRETIRQACAPTGERGKRIQARRDGRRANAEPQFPPKMITATKDKDTP